MNVLDQLHIQSPERIRAVVCIDNPFHAADNAARGRHPKSDLIKSTVLPVIFAGLPVGGPGPVVIGLLYFGWHRKDLRVRKFDGQRESCSEKDWLYHPQIYPIARTSARRPSYI